MKFSDRQEQKVCIQTADRLHSAAIHLLRRLRREDARSGLTASRLSALSVIVFAGPIGMTALAEAEQVRLPTISRLVKSLEREGLVERVAHDRDRRKRLLSATEKGEALLREGRKRRVALLAADLARLEPAKQTLLVEAADLLTALGRGVGDGENSQ